MAEKKITKNDRKLFSEAQEAIKDKDIKKLTELLLKGVK